MRGQLVLGRLLAVAGGLQRLHHLLAIVVFTPRFLTFTSSAAAGSADFFAEALPVAASTFSSADFLILTGGAACLLFLVLFLLFFALLIHYHRPIQIALALLRLAA